MRRATHDTQWMYDNGTLVGLILGYDFCAEHEASVPGLRHDFGVFEGVPVGFEQRRITCVPEILSYHPHVWKPKGQRRKSAGMPAAVLHYERAPWRSPEERLTAAMSETAFYGNPGDRWYEAEKHDIVCAWDARSFAIHVRGADNVARLERLHRAFVEGDVVFSNPSGMGFLRNGGLAFGIFSALSDATKASVRAQDEAHMRLEAAVCCSGIREEIQAAGKGWYALSPRWLDETREEGLEFFLNPQEQSKHNHGWFLLEELRAWCRDEGPVLKWPEEKAFAEANRDWSIAWTNRCKAAGAPLLRNPTLTIKNGEPALSLRVSPSAPFDSGTYTLSELAALVGAADCQTA